MENKRRGHGRSQGGTRATTLRVCFELPNVKRNVRNKLKKEVWGTSSVLPIFIILEVQNFTPKKFISGRGGGGINLAENCQKLYIKNKKADM